MKLIRFFRAENLRLTAQTRGYVAQPKYTLEVMDSSKNPTEVVYVGDEGFLLITPHEVSIFYSFFFSFLTYPTSLTYAFSTGQLPHTSAFSSYVF